MWDRNQQKNNKSQPVVNYVGVLFLKRSYLWHNWLVGQISADQMFKEDRMKTELHFLKKKRKLKIFKWLYFHYKTSSLVKK